MSETYKEMEARLHKELSCGGNYAEMTLRDWFAGQALPATFDLSVKLETQGALVRDGHTTAAEIAYILADAMLEARKK